MDYAYAHKVILEIVRTGSEPIGLALIPSGEPWPEHSLRPSHRGLTCSMCQWTNFARREGVVVGLKAEDIACVPCQLAFGFRVLSEPQALGIFLSDMGYMKSAGPVEKIISQIPFCEPGAYQGILAFPLNKAPIEPDVVWIYGLPAQMSHLVIGLMYELGEFIPSQHGLGLTCRLGFLNHPQILIPGRGERRMGGTGEGELFLSLPGNMLEDLVRGLEATRRNGITAPIAGPGPNNMPPLPQMQKMTDCVVSPFQQNP